jgi:hypothetical protein
MLVQAIILSLQITAVYIVFQQGMLLGDVKIKAANYFDKYLGPTKSRYVQKPIWDCLMCMASVWTIILTLSFNIPLMLLVCGINTLIDKIIHHE